MHSFHPSRGRIVFEVFCAVGLAVSLGGAWQQTGASALLGASVAAALFAISHAFAMKRGPGVVVEPQRVDFAENGEERLVADLNTVEPVVKEEVPPAPTVGMAEPAAPAPPPSKRTRKAKAAKTERRSKAGDEVAAEGSTAQVEALVPMAIEEDHPRIEPLFEPEPFVRQPRAVVFGRKAG